MSVVRAEDGIVRTLDIVTGVMTENGVVVDKFTSGERITLPSAEDLDAVTDEQEVADATASRSDDVPQI